MRRSASQWTALVEYRDSGTNALLSEYPTTFAAMIRSKRRADGQVAECSRETL